jgi:hypothetical protein
MYARLLGLVCLLRVGVVAAPSERMVEGSNEIDVYSRFRSDVSPTIREAIRRETARLMGSSGYRVQWLDQPREVAVSFLVVVDFAGNCNLGPGVTTPTAARRLASTWVEKRRILPFVNVDCNAVSQFLGPDLRSTHNPDPQFLYGRALGRLLAHELYHFVGQTEVHTSAGVTQAAVSVSDLISDQLPFDRQALSKLHASLASIPLVSIRHTSFPRTSLKD